MINSVGNLKAEIWQDVHCLLQLNLRSHRDLLITATVIHQPNNHNKEKVGSNSLPTMASMGKNIPQRPITESAKTFFSENIWNMLNVPCCHTNCTLCDLSSFYINAFYLLCLQLHDKAGKS